MMECGFSTCCTFHFLVGRLSSRCFSCQLYSVSYESLMRFTVDSFKRDFSMVLCCDVYVLVFGLNVWLCEGLRLS